ncbi:MAG TPA: hydroxyacid dehydrogenase [Acidimicrobiia bacterium]|nr:hydroxyacid dehydrogenase [Acidimicrobiia bacterium]
MNADFRVVVTDHVSESGLAPLLEDGRFQVTRVDDSATDAFQAALAEADGLVVRSATRVTRELLAKGPRLKVVGRAGVGVDNIDLPAATERGIAVLNSPAGNTVAAAELTMALILSVVRRVAEADRSMRAGKWERSRLRGLQLKDRTLGLVGAGRIGSEVAGRCRAFGMKILAYDPYLTAERANDIGLALTGLDEVLTRGDIISLHVPLTDETFHLIDEGALSRMKPGAFVVNVSRGGVIDEEALGRALIGGRLAGAALDVFEFEPLPPDSPLLNLPNVVLTPHLGASTVEAQELVAREIAESVRDALALGDLSGSVNST